MIEKVLYCPRCRAKDEYPWGERNEPSSEIECTACEKSSPVYAWLTLTNAWEAAAEMRKEIDQLRQECSSLREQVTLPGPDYVLRSLLLRRVAVGRVCDLCQAAGVTDGGPNEYMITARRVLIGTDESKAGELVHRYICEKHVQLAIIAMFIWGTYGEYDSRYESIMSGRMSLLFYFERDKMAAFQGDSL